MSSYGTHKEVGNPEREQAQYNAALSAAMKGAAGGLAVAGPAAYFLHRTWQPFQRLTFTFESDVCFICNNFSRCDCSR